MCAPQPLSAGLKSRDGSLQVYAKSGCTNGAAPFPQMTGPFRESLCMLGCMDPASALVA